MIIKFGAFALDSDRRQLTRGGDDIHLTPKAFDLLVLLVDEAPRVVRKPELHERLWPGTFVSDATPVGLVKELRRALDDRDPAAPLVRTAHGVGDAFAASLHRELSRAPSAICLDVAGVSRRHARIVVGTRGAVLEDLGSKNGTKVAETSVTGNVPLRDGDQIHVGPVLIIFHVSASGMSTETLSSHDADHARRPAQ